MGMVKMTHVNIYGRDNFIKQTLKTLARQACFQADENDDAMKAAEKEGENIYAPILTNAISLLKDLGAADDVIDYKGEDFNLSETKNTVDKFSEIVAEKRAKEAEMKAKLTTFEQTKAQLYHLTNLHTNVDEIFACSYLKVRFGRLPKDSFSKLPYYADKPFTFNDYDFDGEYYWGVYFAPENYGEEVDKIFASLFFERMWVPDFVHGTPQDALAKLIKEQAELEEQFKHYTQDDNFISAEEIKLVEKMASWLNYESQVYEMQKYVVTLESSFYISGYTPEDDVKGLIESLAMIESVEVLQDEDEPTKKSSKQPPVKLKNNWFSRPFEFFVNMYGLPRYGDIDPTNLVAITYSVLFGIMFGDIGQGLVLGLFGYFIMYKKMKNAIGLILARCSIFSIIFGFVFGSLFGFEHIMEVFYHDVLNITFLPIIPMHPDNLTNILISAVAAGVFIICTSIIVSIVSHFRSDNKIMAFVGVNGLAGVVMYLSLILLIVDLALGMNLPFVGTEIYYIICLIIPFLLVFFSHAICEFVKEKKLHESFGEILLNGFFEMFEIMLSFVSNTMSFLRVAGFVLVHAGMMSVVHTLAGMQSNMVSIVLVYVLGNLAVMVVEGLFVGIQVLRLEFYEIFSRFFKADGKVFTPLQISTKQVKEVNV